MEPEQRKRKKGAPNSLSINKGSEKGSGDDSGDGYFMLETDFDSESEDTSSDNEQDSNISQQKPDSSSVFQSEQLKQKLEEKDIALFDNQENQTLHDTTSTNPIDTIEALLRGMKKEKKEKEKKEKEKGEDEMDIEMQNDIFEQNIPTNIRENSEQKHGDGKELSNDFIDFPHQPLEYFYNERSETGTKNQEVNTASNRDNQNEPKEEEHTKQHQTDGELSTDQTKQKKKRGKKENKMSSESELKNSMSQEFNNAESLKKTETILEPPPKKSKSENQSSKHATNTTSKETKASISSLNKYKETEQRKQTNSKGVNTQDESDEQLKQNEKKLKIPSPFDETVLTATGKGVRFIDIIFKNRKSNDKTSEKEYLTKFKGQSYLDIHWVSSNVLENDPSFNGVLRNFKKQKKLNYFSNDDRKLFNSDFLHVDTILQRKKFNNSHYYLVKWRSLKYSECTWERRKAIHDDKSVSLFRKRSKECETAVEQAAADEEREQRNGRRGRFIKYKDSPLFKGGKTIEDFQIEGVNQLLTAWGSRKNVIIGDDITIGARQEAVFLLEIISSKTGMRGPFLIVTSQPLIPIWKRIFECWTNFYAIALPNIESEREFVVEHEFYFDDLDVEEAIEKSVFKFNVVITSFETFSSMNLLNEKIHWRCTFIDFASKSKQSPATDITIFKNLISDYKALIVKDFFSFNLEEIWQLLIFLNPKRFEFLTKFKRTYKSLTDAEGLTKFRENFSDIILSRTREEIKNMTRQDSETIIEVEMTPLQLKCYRKVLTTDVNDIFQGVVAPSPNSLSNVLMNIRKCVNHPYVFSNIRKIDLSENENEEEMTIEQKLNHLLQASSKLIVLDKLLSRLNSEKKTVVIFVQMDELLDILEEFLKYRKYTYVRIDGFVYGNDRNNAIETFNNQLSGCFVCIINIKSTDPLVTFSNADTTIIFDSDWDLQGGVNILRSINCNKTNVYRLITKGTCEEFITRKSLSEAANYFLVSEEEVKRTKIKNYSMRYFLDILKRGAIAGVHLPSQTPTNFSTLSIDEILKTSSTVVPYWSCTTSPFFTEEKFKSVINNDDLLKQTFWDDLMKEIIRIDPEVTKVTLLESDSEPTSTSNSLSLSYSASFSESHSGRSLSQSRRKRHLDDQEGTNELQEEHTSSQSTIRKNKTAKRKTTEPKEKTSETSEHLSTTSKRQKQNAIQQETTSILQSKTLDKEPAKQDFFYEAQGNEGKNDFNNLANSPVQPTFSEGSHENKTNPPEVQKKKRKRTNNSYSTNDKQTFSELSSPKQNYNTSDDTTRGKPIANTELGTTVSLEFSLDATHEQLSENAEPSSKISISSKLSRNTTSTDQAIKRKQTKKTWSENEVNRLNESLVNFGFGRWLKVQSSGKLERFSLGEIAAFSRVLLAKCLERLPYDQIIHYSRIIASVDLVSIGYKEGDALLSKHFEYSSHLKAIFKDEEYWHKDMNSFLSAPNTNSSSSALRETNLIDNPIAQNDPNITAIKNPQEKEEEPFKEMGVLKTNSRAYGFDKRTELRHISNIDKVIESINQSTPNKIFIEQNELSSTQMGSLYAKTNINDNIGTKPKALFSLPSYVYDDEPIFNTAQFTIFLKEKSETFIHRLCVLAIIYDIILHFDNFNNICTEERQSADWTPENDKKLFIGILKWGLDHYDQIKRDNKFSLSPRVQDNSISTPQTAKDFPSVQFLIERTKIIIKMFCEQEASHSRQIQDNNDWSSNEKFIIFKMLSIFGIPQESEWNQFAKTAKLTKSIPSIKAYCLNLYEKCRDEEGLYRLECATRKTKQSPQTKETRRKGSSHIISSHAINSESDSDDSLDIIYRNQPTNENSLNNRIDIEDEEITNNKELSSLVYSDDDIDIITDKYSNAYQQDEDVYHAENITNDDTELSATKGHFLYERINFISRIQKIFQSSPQLIEQIITEETKPSSKMPDWWKPGEHDICLLFGVTKYGIGQWSKMLKDPKLPFAQYTQHNKTKCREEQTKISRTSRGPLTTEKELTSNRSSDSSTKGSFANKFMTESSFFIKRIKYLIELLEETVSPEDSKSTYEQRRELSLKNWMETRHLISYKKELRFINNQFNLPIYTGVISIRSLGEIIFTPDTFHTTNHIFPNNYAALRKYRSIFAAGTESVYECLIQATEGTENDEALRPSFYISTTANSNSLFEWVETWKRATGKDNVQFKIVPVTSTEKLIIYSGRTPNEVFSKLKEDIKITQPNANERMSGSTFFGLNEDITRLAIQSLPNAELCNKYIFHYPVRVGEKIILKQPPKEKYNIIESLEPSFKWFCTPYKKEGAGVFQQPKQLQDQTDCFHTPLRHRYRTQTNYNEHYPLYNYQIQRGLESTPMSSSNASYISSGFQQPYFSPNITPHQPRVTEQSVDTRKAIQQQMTPLIEPSFLPRGTIQFQLALQSPQQLNYNRTLSGYPNQSHQTYSSTNGPESSQDYTTINSMQLQEKMKEQGHYLQETTLNTETPSCTQTMNPETVVAHETVGVQGQLTGTMLSGQQVTSDLFAYSQPQRVATKQDFRQSQRQFQLSGTPNGLSTELQTSVNHVSQDYTNIHSTMTQTTQQNQPPTPMKTPVAQATFI